MWMKIPHKEKLVIISASTLLYRHYSVFFNDYILQKSLKTWKYQFCTYIGASLYTLSQIILQDVAVLSIVGQLNPNLHDVFMFRWHFFCINFRLMTLSMFLSSLVLHVTAVPRLCTECRGWAVHTILRCWILHHQTLL